MPVANLTPIYLPPLGGTHVIVSGNTPIFGGNISFPPGGFAGGGVGFNGTAGVPVVTKNPIQVVGFVPLTSCSATQCRIFCECEYVNKVFGNLSSGVAIATSTYENDWNTFLVDYSLYVANPTVTNSATVNFILQKKSGSNWIDVVTLIDNSYGIIYPLNSIIGHPSYAGYAINWGKVLQLQGAGFYRLKITSLFREIRGCLVSEPFCLSAWSCLLADKTTKFEATLTGKIGSIDIDGYLYDICGFNWFDSIRIKGMLGFETTEYREEMLEYNNGLMERERDEALQKFQWITTPQGLPKWLLDRFKVYGMMADKLLGSDYCYNNSDYSFRQKMLVKSGGFKPTYRVSSRKAKVTVDFSEGIQNVIKSKCCEVIKAR